MNKEFKKFTLMDETPSAPASDKTIMIDDIDKLALEEAKKLHDKGKHEDWDIYNQLVYEDAEMIKIGYNKAKETLYTEEQVKKAYEYGSNASLGISKTNLINHLKNERTNSN